MTDVPIINPDGESDADPEGANDAMEGVVIALANANALILDYATQAAKEIVRKHLVALGHSDQGPDAGSGADGHPATATFAVALFKQITDDLKAMAQKAATGRPGSPLALPPGVKIPNGMRPEDWIQPNDDDPGFETSIAKGVDTPGNHNDDAPDLP